MKSFDRTTRGRITSHIRLLWLRSRERAIAEKRDNYSCIKCHKKKSKAKGKEQKIHVHHKKGKINWDKIVNVIQEELLVSPEQLETLCPNCHALETWGK